MSNRNLKLLSAICLILITRLSPAAEPANPLLLDNALYVSAQGVHKFNLDTLEKLWSSLTGVETFAPVSSGALILVGSTRGLYALNSDNGEIAWHIEKQRSIFSPVVSGQVFAGSIHGELYSIDPGDGKINWRRQFPGWIYSPAVDAESGLLWSGGQAHKAYAITIADGRLVKEIKTTQEHVFSPVNLGSKRIAFNLFDGSTLILQSPMGEIVGSLSGSVQPKDIYRYGQTIYRSDRGGGLSAFRLDNLSRMWHRTLVTRDLNMHPAQPGYLLLSDKDQSLILFDLENEGEIRRLQISGQWLAPIQVDARKIVYFQKLMQPPWLLAVQPIATY